MQVTDYLKEKYSGQFTAGKKHNCVKCGKLTLSISQSDKIATCWHPACNFRVTSEMIKQSNDKDIHYALQVIYDIFKDELMKVKDGERTHAYNYLFEERKIHEDVIAISMLGMVPESFDSEVLFEEVISNFTSKISVAKSDAEKGLLERELARTKEHFEKLGKLFNYNKGWICFFNIDERLRIVEIGLRKPYCKEFASFKVKSGIFSIGFTTEKEAAGSSLLIVEGQMNLLQLQSLQRQLTNDGEEPEYINAISIGAASNANYDVIKAINRNPIFSYDADDAGFAVVSKAQEFLHVSGFRTPEPYNDLDEYIRSFGEDYGSAKKGIEELIENRKFYYRHFEPLGRVVNAIRSSKKKEFLIQQEVSEIIIDDMLQRGKLYFDGNYGYYFNEEINMLSKISKEDTSLTLLLSKYKLTATETIYNYLISNLMVETLDKGRMTRVHRFAYYDKKIFKIYLYNNDNKIYMISKEDIKLVSNGYDGVLFLNDAQCEPFVIDKDIAKDSNQFDKILVDEINFEQDNLTNNERKFIYKTWLFSLFVESIMPTKPIMCFLGGKGSGKTLTMRKIGIALFGPRFNVTSLGTDPRDFDTAVTNSYFVAIDNCDSKIDWIETKLAIMATGGKIKRRELYTTNTMVEIETHCYLSITSRTPYFRRDDVADRLLIMKVGRIQAIIAENAILSDVINNRNIIMSEVARDLKGVLKLLEEKKDYRYEGQLRMADYGDFAYKIASQVDNHLSVETIFNKINKGQTEFTLEQDPIVDLLFTWLTETRNQNRLVTVKELYDDLVKLSNENNERFLLKSHQSLAQKLRNIKSNLQNYFIINEHIGGARQRKISFDYKHDEIGDVIETEQRTNEMEDPF